MAHVALTNSELGSLDVIKTFPIGTMVKRTNFVFGASGAGNNWAKAHFTEGVQLIDGAVDVIRKEGESCDCPKRFQITHLCGGTGSELASLLSLKIRDNYPDRITSTFSVYPSPKVSDVLVEPYNTSLIIDQSLENSDETFVIDNGALHNILHNILKQQQGKYAEINWVISFVMSSGIAASLLFSGIINDDLRKMGMNLVPFQRLRFFSIAQAQPFGPGDAKHVNVTSKCTRI